MSTQFVAELLSGNLDQIAYLSALQGLLVAVVKSHPAKAEVLECYRDMMEQLSERMRDRAHPDVAQADPVFAQATKGSAETLDLLANASAQFAGKLQGHVEHPLKECQ